MCLSINGFGPLRGRASDLVDERRLINAGFFCLSPSSPGGNSMYLWQEVGNIHYRINSYSKLGVLDGQDRNSTIANARIVSLWL